MRLFSLPASFILSTSFLTAVVPAYAGPLDSYHGSILDPASSTLSNDPRALCSDVVASNTSIQKSSSDVESTYKQGSMYFNKSSQANSNSEDEKIGGSASFMGIGGSASYEDKTANSSSSSNEGRSENNSAAGNINKASSESTTSTAVAAGRNCDAFVKASAERDAAAYSADAQVQSVRYATDAKLKATQAQMNAQFLDGLLKW
jgi:hypothetical protein